MPLISRDARIERPVTAAVLWLVMLALAGTPSAAGDGQAAPRPKAHSTPALQTRAPAPRGQATPGEQWVATWGTALQLARFAGGPGGRPPGAPMPPGAPVPPGAPAAIPPPAPQGFPAPPLRGAGRDSSPG